MRQRKYLETIKIPLMKVDCWDQVDPILQKIDDAVERWMTEAEQKTIKLVDDNWDRIEQLSTILLDKEIMYEDELKSL